MLERDRHQRQQRPVHRADGIQKRRGYTMRADQWRNFLRLIKQRENIGFGKQAAKRFQHFFAAAHSQQPVMNDCDPHPGWMLFYQPRSVSLKLRWLLPARAPFPGACFFKWRPWARTPFW